MARAMSSNVGNQPTEWMCRGGSLGGNRVTLTQTVDHTRLITPGMIVPSSRRNWTAWPGDARSGVMGRHSMGACLHRTPHRRTRNPLAMGAGGGSVSWAMPSPLHHLGGPPHEAPPVVLDHGPLRVGGLHRLPGHAVQQ